MIKQVSYFSPAKINLFLEVLSRRSDKYHEINSLICFCDIGDFIEVTESNALKLQIKGPFAKELPSNNNILIKTHEILNRYFKINNFNINLTKNLPIASGIGGGSSNAATLFRIIESHLNLKIDIKLKNKILLEIGADVPICYYQRLSIVSGIGEKIQYLQPISDTYILLINPLVEVSTKEIFKNLNIFSRKKTILSDLDIKKRVFLNKIIKSKNDLELVAKSKYSSISEVIEIMDKESNAILVRMSGSGATCFALFHSIKDRDLAYKRIIKKKKSWWIKKGKILNKAKFIT